MSLKVIGTDTDRSATYDFLLVIHSMSLSYTVSEIYGDFRRKSHIFPTLVYLTPPPREFALEFCNRETSKSCHAYIYQTVQRVLTIYAFVSAQFDHSKLVVRCTYIP